LLPLSPHATKSSAKDKAMNFERQLRMRAIMCLSSRNPGHRHQRVTINRGEIAHLRRQPGLFP
jgi:hypothetical protein